MLPQTLQSALDQSRHGRRAATEALADSLKGPVLQVVQRQRLTLGLRQFVKGCCQAQDLFVALGALLAFALPAAGAFAGTSGAIRGIVSDSSGTPVAGVHLRISSPSQQQSEEKGIAQLELK